MAEPEFEIGAKGIDTAKVVEEVRAKVAAKMAAGAYTDPRIARAEKNNLLNLQNEEEFLSFYLDCLRDAVVVDINDFHISERRTKMTGAFRMLKKLIWKMLKFYTYRLWSQQNQSNSLLLSAIEGIENRYREKIRNLEERVRRLEAGRTGADR